MDTDFLSETLESNYEFSRRHIDVSEVLPASNRAMKYEDGGSKHL